MSCSSLRSLEALLHEPAQRRVQVAVVEEVVAHLVEERLGVEVEAGLRAVPARVPEPGDPPLAANQHRSTLPPLRSHGLSPPERPRGHNGGPCEPPRCSSPRRAPHRSASPPARATRAARSRRPSKPFCEAAHRYDVRVEKLAPIGGADPDRPADGRARAEGHRQATPRPSSTRCSGVADGRQVGRRQRQDQRTRSTT